MVRRFALLRVDDVVGDGGGAAADVQDLHRDRVQVREAPEGVAALDEKAARGWPGREDSLGDGAVVQVMMAVKSAGRAQGLASVKVATTPMNFLLPVTFRVTL